MDVLAEDPAAPVLVVGAGARRPRAGQGRHVVAPVSLGRRGAPARVGWGDREPELVEALDVPPFVKEPARGSPLGVFHGDGHHVHYVEQDLEQIRLRAGIARRRDGGRDRAHAALGERIGERIRLQAACLSTPAAPPLPQTSAAVGTRHPERGI